MATLTADSVSRYSRARTQLAVISQLVCSQAKAETPGKRKILIETLLSCQDEYACARINRHSANS